MFALVARDLNRDGTAASLQTGCRKEVRNRGKVRSWHKTDMRSALTNVCDRRKSGNGAEGEYEMVHGLEGMSFTV